MRSTPPEPRFLCAAGMGKRRWEGPPGARTRPEMPAETPSYTMGTHHGDGSPGAQSRPELSIKAPRRTGRTVPVVLILCAQLTNQIKSTGV